MTASRLFHHFVGDVDDSASRVHCRIDIPPAGEMVMTAGSSFAETHAAL